ncbi:MAG: hypothetical protein A2075_07590 [Geobacteraceae bacterium GWC2_58_44]|nr:MAG: hypothetical protein A2075_07590 [Geobacteraceae bacterium GWC2_58_44]HBG05564.1 type IV secretion protein Rhs [Geobacter sp.]
MKVAMSICRGRFITGLVLLALGLVSATARAEHRDAMPLPDEVVSQIVEQQHGRDDPLALALSHHLDEAAVLLRQIEEETTTDDAGFATKRMLLEAKANELGVVRAELRTRFATTRERLVSLGLTEQVDAWDMLRGKVEERFERLGRSLEEVRTAPDMNGRGKAVSSARSVLHDLHGKRQEQGQVGSVPLPTWTFEKRPSRPPDYDHAAPPAFLSSKTRPLNNIYAFNGNTLLAPEPDPVPGEASTCGYTGADLAVSWGVKWNDGDIKLLAKQLGYSAARIFEYVANEIQFEPYYGSLKGATGTLVAKAGNATDQASLLIALLRASNIPARYVKGTVNSANEDRLLRWLGVKTQTAAAEVLREGGIPQYFNSSTGTLQFTHVWVEACVPYAHYRGAKVDNAGHRWIPLDPSFKDKSYQDGIRINVNFDYGTYMATRSNTLPFEAYEQQVESTVKSISPNNVLEDVPYKGVLLQKRVDILPASPPYEIVNFQAWEGGITSDTAEVPGSHQVTFEVNVKNGGGHWLTGWTFFLPGRAMTRITLKYTGLTQTDKDNLAAWKSDTFLDSNIPCTIQVVPHITQEGIGRVSGSVAVNLCTQDNQLTLDIKLKELALDGNCPTTYNPILPSPCYLNHVLYKNIGAADYHALLAYAFQTSDDHLSTRSKKLLNSVRANVNPMTNEDETTGEFLNIVGLKYLRYISAANKRIGELDGGTGESGNHLGLASTRAKVNYLFDLPFAVYRKGFLIDMPGCVSRNLDISTGEPVWKTFQLSGYTASAYEAYIWQENARLDAVSTIRGIQYAKETGIEVLTLTSANWSVLGDATSCGDTRSQCYKLTHNSNSGLNYSYTERSDIYNNYISQGHTVTMPRSLIQYQNWKGPVYIAEKDSIAVDGKMSATYAINNSAGGETVSDPVSVDYSTVTDSGYVQASTGTTTTTAVVSVGDGTISNGQSQYNTESGDPVNMVTGNVYHTERDISLKGRGGLPLVFERSYNSRNPQKGPLGYGWTHSFNHYLTFVVTNGVTSAVSWTDGTGSQKLIKVTGNGAGVPIGSTFTPPKGFYFKMARGTDGKYTIRERNGLTYTFESSSGISTQQKARLISIRDRNNNTLTLTYEATGTITVSDGLGHFLKLEYAGGDKILEVTDWTGRRHRYNYNANGDLVLYSNPLALAGTQSAVTYEYYGVSDGINLNHALKKYTLPRGNSMSFEYYANGRAFRHYNTLNETNTFTYNDFRRETVQVNERDFSRHFFFDEYGNPEEIIEENSAQRKYTYDPANPYNRTTKKDPEGYQTSYEYDASGNVTQITNPSTATTAFSNFNTFNQPGKVKDARGNYTLYKYDASGNLLQEIRLKSGLGAGIDPTTYVPVASEIVAWTVNSYDSYGNPLTSRKVRDFAAQIANSASLTGPTLEYDYNDTTNGVTGLNLVSITRRGDKNGDGTIAAGEYDIASLTYDSLGRMKTGIDGDWQRTVYDYDDVDRVTRGTDATGNQRDYIYDANGNPSGQTLVLTYNELPKLLDSSSSSYDLSDRRETTTDAGGYVTAYIYDPAGNVVIVSNPDDYTISFDYDENNRVIKAYDQENNAVTRTLDLSGKPRTITDPNGNKTTYEYYDSTKDGRLKKVTQPRIQAFSVGQALQYDYDSNGNVISGTDIPADGSANRTTLTTYDELNRPSRIVGPQYTDAVYGAIHPVTKYTYDTLGNLSRVDAGRTDSSGTNPATDVVTTLVAYQYDDFGRKLKETDPLGKFWTFVYDVNNNVTTMTDAKEQATGYTWGYGHQMLTKTNIAGNVTYTRSALGQVIKAKSPEVTYNYTYDTTHRLESVTDSRGGKMLSYTYSPGGLLNWVTDSDGNETDYLYDKIGRLSGIWAANYETVTFKYDPGGRLTEKWFPNGVNSLYTYNADNSLEKVVNRSNASTIISQHVYSYDGVGNRLTHAESVGGVTINYGYQYDALNRLTQVGNGTAPQQENYGYDPLNNRTTKKVNITTPVITAYVYDAANQLKEIRQESTTGTVLASMLYDDNGNMYQKTEGATTTTLGYDALNRLTQVDKTGISTQNYTYDDQGRRIAKTIDSTTAKYLYNGPDIVAEYGDWASPTAQFTHGPNTDDPIIRATATAAQYFHQDGLGSVVALSDQTGATTCTQRFDAWGKTIAASGNSIPQYGYTGREPDETGLVYYRARHYDPTIGRFTQRDPIRLQGGINPYAYANANPVTFTDPEGLLAFDNAKTNESTEQITYYVGSNTGQASAGISAGTQSFADAGKYANMASDADPPGIAVAKAYGAIAAWTYGHAAGDKFLVDVAVQGMAENKQNFVNAGFMLLTIGSGGGSSKIDRAAFKVEREAFWKTEAKSNPGKFSAEDLTRMEKGRAPTGPDGHPMELHHVDRTPDGGVDAMSRTDHRLGGNFKKNHR